MRVTLSAASPFSFTVHQPGVTVELNGASVPQPDEPGTPQTPPAPQVSGYDRTTNAALLEAFDKRLDPIGAPDQVELSPLGYQWSWYPHIDTFTRSNSCYRWTCAIVPPTSGEYSFEVRIKSGGAVVFDGIVVWAVDREPDPLSTADGYTVTFKRTLEAGKLYPFRCHVGYQGFLFGCTVQWLPPGKSELEPVSTLYCHPPADWQQRLKQYVPPPPEPAAFRTPDASYQSPDLITRLFPADSPWNTPIDQAEIDPLSDVIISRLGDIHLHPVFGVGHGIPFEVVPAGTPKRVIQFDYAAESDAGPYPLPEEPLLESGGGDGHWIGVSPAENRLYELFLVRRDAGTWKAGSGAIFDLVTGQRVPGWKPGWTSADAAGLPIVPGLVRPDEVTRGEIAHALRVSVPKTRRAFVAPATHWASTETDEALPPMGCRLRLKASLDETAFPEAMRPLVKALKLYGVMVADNGGPFIGLCGVPDRRWDDDVLAALKVLRAGDFEVVRMGEIVTSVP